MKKDINISGLKIRAFCILLPIVIGATFSLPSCKKFVEIPPPNSQVVTASVFNNAASATSALTGIYTQMWSNNESANLAYTNALLSDELVTYDNASNGPILYYQNRQSSSIAVGLWGTYYNYIYQANAVISGLNQYSGTSPAVKQQLLGEAYFLRAFWHLYLTNEYGAVPLALTTDYTVTDKLPRTPKVQVLQQVISDLKTAEGLLSKNYVDGSDTTTTTDRVRPNQAVATALLARAYLYLGDYDNNNTTDYDNAVSAATALINNSAYSLSALSGSDEVFTKNSSETIWQLYTPLPAGYNTKDGNYFILLAAPSTNSVIGSYTISTELMNAFEPGDQRLTNWVGSITAGGNTYYFPYKYKVRSGGTTISEYTMVLRLAEQYLIRAEAKAELGDPTAVNDLNVIRIRAGLPNYSGAQDKASLLSAILHERQVEMFTEWGSRWFDLNRAIHTASTVNVNTVMSVVTPLKGGGAWNSNKQLYPIPLGDLQKDVYLTQNPGY